LNPVRSFVRGHSASRLIVRIEFVSRLPKYTPITLIAALAVIAHAVCVTVFVRAATPLSYAFLVLSPVLAGVACLLRARDEAPGARAPWYLLAMGTLLWASGMTLSAWEEMYQQLPSRTFCISFTAFRCCYRFPRSRPSTERRCLCGSTVFRP
jgi:hypothetical protein